MAPTPVELEAVRRRLLTDFEFYAPNALKIVTKAGETIPFVLKRPQIRLARALERQREAGMPRRAMILKPRQIGMCLAPHTRVLTADLRWLRLDEIQPGQEIVAVDEQPPGGSGKARKLCRAVVEAKWEVKRPAVRLTMDDGRELTATAEHRFLCRRRGGVETQWRTVETMRPGDVIRHVTFPWEPGELEDGWMGGVLDGEGCLRARRAGAEASITQLPGLVFDRARRYLRSEGYTFREDVDARPAESGGKFSNRDVHHLVLSRTNEILRLVGRTRPARFLARSDWWEGRELPGKRSGVAWSAVVAIEPLGAWRMIDLQTSASTFIAEGFVSHNSTQAQGLLVQDVTQRPNWLAIVVAQDRPVAGALFGIGKTMVARLPEEIRPEVAYESNTLDRKYLQFGEASLQARKRGELGLNSAYEIATAKEATGGRGRTIRALHLSEVAFYPNTDKILGLVNAVPDIPDSLILKESTAQGFNHFKDDWDAAEAGESGYYAMFSPWFEEDEYRRPFASDRARSEFESSLGTGKYGDDEAMLVELVEADLRKWAVEDGKRVNEGALRTRVLEHLHWRRAAIPAKCDGDPAVFREEYPSTPDEAFLSTGQKVFASVLVREALQVVERYDPVAPTPEAPGPVRGLFRPTAMRAVRSRRHMTIEIPQAVEWVPASKARPDERALWRVWSAPVKAADGIPDGQYILAGDPASGEEDEQGIVHANHGVSIIDHRTLAQVATYESQIDPDLLALELYCAALYFNRAWIVVERTGGYGLSINRALALDYRYPRVYEEKSRDKRIEDRYDRLGFSTDHVTKPLLNAHGLALLREGTHGLRSRPVVMQMLSYIRDARGRTRPEAGKQSDLLMAWLIAQFVAANRPVRPDRPRGATSTRPRVSGRSRNFAR